MTDTFLWRDGHIFVTWRTQNIKFYWKHFNTSEPHISEKRWKRINFSIKKSSLRAFLCNFKSYNSERPSRHKIASVTSQNTLANLRGENYFIILSFLHNKLWSIHCSNWSKENWQNPQIQSNSHLCKGDFLRSILCVRHVTEVFLLKIMKKIIPDIWYFT